MKKSVCIFFALLTLAGCVSEDKEKFSRQMKIESVPDGAAVIVDGFKLGKTPLEIGVETTEDGHFVRRTSITLIPADSKHFTQAETFPAYRKSNPEGSEVPEKIIFDLTKNPEKGKTVTIE